jgi:hypothetical protein
MDASGAAVKKEHKKLSNKNKKKRETLIVVINLAPIFFSFTSFNFFLSLCCRFSSITNVTLQGLCDKKGTSLYEEKKIKIPYNLLSL